MKSSAVNTTAVSPAQPLREGDNTITALLDAAPHIMFCIDAAARIVCANTPEAYPALQPGVNLSRNHTDLWAYIAQIKPHRPLPGPRKIAFEGKHFTTWAIPFEKDGKPYRLCVLESRLELDRMKIQAAQYQQLSRELDAIIASSDDGLWVCDSQGIVLRINAASERINMVRAADMVGRTMTELVSEGLIDRSVTLEVIRTKARQNMIQQTRAGRKLILTGNPVFDLDGKLIRVVVNERDITEIDTLSRRLKEQTVVKNLMQHQLLEMQLSEITDDVLIARSPSMEKAVRQALKLSQVNTTVLISGESGTGKGLISRLIHKHSDRSAEPMVEINCGAIPANLVETELFGYRKGAFTGADMKGKPGYLELAHNGTLFLDEIAELPLSAQVKFLRFLENGNVTRVGGTVSRKVDVRILCATHQDLNQMVADGRFRKDLYYRLHVIPLKIPPLRHRKECILPLMRHYLHDFCSRFKHSHKKRLSRRAMDTLLHYAFPGNVRELINLCERLVVMGEGSEIRYADLPGAILAADQEKLDAGYAFEKEGSLPRMLAITERRILADTYRRCNTQARMAEALGVHQATIARKMKKYGLG